MKYYLYIERLINSNQLTMCEVCLEETTITIPCVSAHKACSSCLNKHFILNLPDLLRVDTIGCVAGPGCSHRWFPKELDLTPEAIDAWNKAIEAKKDLESLKTKQEQIEREQLLNSGSNDFVTVLCNQIQNELIDRCPHCSIAFVDYDACNHVTCHCGGRFCGLCLCYNWRNCGCKTYGGFKEHQKTRMLVRISLVLEMFYFDLKLQSDIIDELVKKVFNDKKR